MTVTLSGTNLLIDLHPPGETLEQDVLRGLQQSPKVLPPKLLYDERGSELFDRICELEEYYPTRTELGIMRDHIEEMVRRIGPRCAVIEYGSGTGLKTKFLLEHLVDPAAYVPIDISQGPLLACAAELNELFPGLQIVPIRADFMQRIELPEFNGNADRRLVYFPGSTIGNLECGEAREFLCHVRDVCGDDGALLIGVDLKKDRTMLERAYNDREGVTAEFNLNLLRRLNRELDADFDLSQFRHLAVYNESKSRIEMHLMSLCRQTVSVAGVDIDFEDGETIHTESSHKYDLEEVHQLAANAGFRVEEVWVDENRLFSVQFWAAACPVFVRDMAAFTRP